MKPLFSISPKAFLHGALIVITVALLVIEANLLFATKSDGLFAQAPGNPPAAAAQPAQPAAGGVPAPAPAEPAISALDSFPAEAVQAEQNKCVDYMRLFIEASEQVTAQNPKGLSPQAKFADFINAHFKSKKLTSELLPVAFQRIRQYQTEVYARLDDYVSSREGGRLALAVANEDGACHQYVEGHLQLVKSLFFNHAIENAYAKKSTRLLDKYKEINGALERLNMDVSQLYANFSIFAQKLPCYATECVSQ